MTTPPSKRLQTIPNPSTSPGSEVDDLTELLAYRLQFNTPPRLSTLAADSFFKVEEESPSRVATTPLCVDDCASTPKSGDSRDLIFPFDEDERDVQQSAPSPKKRFRVPTPHPSEGILEYPTTMEAGELDSATGSITPKQTVTLALRHAIGTQTFARAFQNQKSSNP